MTALLRRCELVMAVLMLVGATAERAAAAPTPPAIVPEPSSVILTGLTAAGLGLYFAWARRGRS